jgi:hypothetical protein
MFLACRRLQFAKNGRGVNQDSTHPLKEDQMLKFDAPAKDFRSLSYARAMRAVGLLLEMRDLKTFDLKCDNREFRLKCGYQKPPCSTTVELRYSIDEIESLERDNLIICNDSRKVVDFVSLAEVLHGLGGYVDKKNGRLVRISNNDSNIAMGSVKLEYESSDGDLQEETFSLSSIYDICVRMYKEQGKTKTPTSIFADSRR